MYRDLKNAIWDALDAELAASFGIFPDKARLNRRFYALGPGRCIAYLVLEYGDVAGGSFSFLGALCRAPRPDPKAIYSRELACPSGNGTCLVPGQSLIANFPEIRVELSWQTPPRELVLEALQLPGARELLDGLGVTETERHHLLSFGILETLGIVVGSRHYSSVLELVLPEIRSVMAGSVTTLAGLLREKAARCNRLSP